MLAVLKELYPECRDGELQKLAEQAEHCGSSGDGRAADPVGDVAALLRSKGKKAQLADVLYATFNRHVFENKLPVNMRIQWNEHLQTTAGFCKCKRYPNGQRYCVIELAPKVCRNGEQIRDTLLHEMCHAATWLIDEVRENHGPHWKFWCSRANRVFPDIPILKTRHSYDVVTKYRYQCSKCGHRVQRRCKSVDLERKVCPVCRSKLLLLQLDKKTGRYVNL